MRRCGRHPNVVHLLDVVWVTPDEVNSFGEANLVMELAAGGGLFERLVSEGAYTERLASAIMQQVARAVYPQAGGEGAPTPTAASVPHSHLDHRHRPGCSHAGYRAALHGRKPPLAPSEAAQG